MQFDAHPVHLLLPAAGPVRKQRLSHGEGHQRLRLLAEQIVQAFSLAIGDHEGDDGNIVFVGHAEGAFPEGTDGLVIIPAHLLRKHQDPVSAAMELVESLVELAHAGHGFGYRDASHVAEYPTEYPVEMFGIHGNPHPSEPTHGPAHTQGVEDVYMVADTNGSVLQLFLVRP